MRLPDCPFCANADDVRRLQGPVDLYECRYCDHVFEPDDVAPPPPKQRRERMRKHDLS